MVRCANLSNSELHLQFRLWAAFNAFVLDVRQSEARLYGQVGELRHSTREMRVCGELHCGELRLVTIPVSCAGAVSYTAASCAQGTNP